MFNLIKFSSNDLLANNPKLSIEQYGSIFKHRLSKQCRVNYAEENNSLHNLQSSQFQLSNKNRLLSSTLSNNEISGIFRAVAPQH